MAESKLPSPRFVPSAWLVVLISTVAGYGPSLAVVSGGLDSSWQLGLSWARVTGLEWGRDILFTYGPWGALAAPVPLSAGLLGVSIAVRAAAIGLVAWATLRIGGARGGGRAAVLAFVAAAAAASTGLATGLLLAVVLLALSSVLRSETGLALPALLGGLAGFGVLLKFNTGVAAVAIGSFVMAGMVRRSVSVACFAVFACAGTLGGWLAAGQSPSAIAPFFRGGILIASGYSSAMRHVRDDLASWLPLAVLAYCVAYALGLAALAFAAGRGLPASRRVVLAVAVAGTVAVLSLSGSTRLDAGHLALLPPSLFVLGAPFLSTLGGRRFAGVPVAAAAAVALGAGCVGASVAILGLDGVRHYLHPASSVRGLANELRIATSDSAREHRIEAEKAAIRERYPVPAWEAKTPNPAVAGLRGPSAEVVSALRGERVHVEPWAISAAWAHGLEWRPVPVMQTYAAYTRELDGINEAATRSAAGPSAVLRQSASIDGKHPLWESPGHQIALLCNFEEVASDGLWHALRRVSDRCAPPRLLGRVTADAEERVPVPRVPGAIVIAELRSVTADSSSRVPVIVCNGSPHRLSQGLPSGPLAVDTAASRWDSRLLPVRCDTIGASRRVEISFSALSVRGDE